jgi:uncharacterized protein YeaO (DUF488 family)
MAKLAIKRVYERASSRDGQRVLIDRLWPRGLGKQELGDVIWLKNVAPSAHLRKWFGHKPARWPEFRKRYFSELKRSAEALSPLRVLMKRGRTTLLYSARDTEHNQAVALAEYLVKSSDKR